MLLITALTAVLLSGSPAAPAAKPVTLVPRARAWAVEASAVQGAPLVKVGDHVDVLAVITDPDTKLPAAVTLLQNVIVLSNKPAVAGGPSFVSLLVIPEEAELLALARAAGALTLSLREPTDRDIIEQGKVVTLKTLLGH